MMQDRGPDEERLEKNAELMQGLIELRGRHIASSAECTRSYDELHAEGYLEQRESFYKWLLSLLCPQPGRTLLDVSCGRGMLLSCAAREGLQVAGLDLSSRAVGTAALRVPSSNFVVANAEELPYPDNWFYYVTNIGSVEHYFHPDRAIREMARVLRGDGLALILLPNTFGLLGNFLHAWRKGDVFDDGQPLQRYGSRLQWHRLLELNGLRVVRTLKYERARPRTWADLGWYARRPHRLFRVFLTPLIPCNLASFLIYQCQKNL